jgi:2,4-dienoyl-CoA reductase-like NADH-dependent reductase (Old Yellow Enzyme family)
MSLDTAPEQARTGPATVADEFVAPARTYLGQSFRPGSVDQHSEPPRRHAVRRRVRWLVARATGGFGLTMTCATYVDPGGKAWEGQLGISDDRHLPALTRLADGIRAAGSISAVQLHHGGRRADSALTGVPTSRRGTMPTGTPEP